MILERYFIIYIDTIYLRPAPLLQDYFINVLLGLVNSHLLGHVSIYFIVV